MLINCLEPGREPHAVVGDNVLEELYVERQKHRSLRRNILPRQKIRGVQISNPRYPSRLRRFGRKGNGFLHISDVETAVLSQAFTDPKKSCAESDESPPRPNAIERADAGNSPGLQRGDARSNHRSKNSSNAATKFLSPTSSNEGIGHQSQRSSTYLLRSPASLLVLMPAHLACRSEPQDRRRRRSPPTLRKQHACKTRRRDSGSSFARRCRRSERLQP